MSARRSRNGGTAMGRTLRRKKRSSRNWPAATAAWRSVLVMAMRRASIRRVSVPPRRSNVRSCKTRSNFVCALGESAATSSRTIVPAPPSSRRPSLRSIAPVNDPRSWPNSSLSTSAGGSEAQSILRKGASRRGPSS